MAEQGRIRIAAIGGSVREGAMTTAALAVVTAALEESGARVDSFDPRQLRLAPPGSEPDDPGVLRLRESVEQATGVVLATPEYHGSYSSVIKLVIENLGFPSRLAGKPVALVGVAAGQIGAIKALEHLRSVCSHVGAIVLPGPVSVAGVRAVFDAAGRPTDSKVEKRLQGAARGLLDYIGTSVCPRMTLEAMARES